MDSDFLEQGMGNRVWGIGFYCLLFLLTACQAAATPVPIGVISTPDALSSNISVSNPNPVATSETPVRYGIAAHSIDYLGDLSALNGSIETFQAGADTSLYDIAIAYGRYEGWLVSPVSEQVTLIFNIELAPLDNAEIRDIIRSGIDANQLLADVGIEGISASSPSSDSLSLRNRLANMGYPDGFELTLAYEKNPVLEGLVTQFAALNMDLRLVEISAETAETILSENRAHMVLLRTRQLADVEALTLFDLPLSYLAKPDFTIEFSARGLPIITYDP